LEGREHEDEEFTPRAYFLANRVALLNIPIQFHRITRKGSITESTLLNFKERHLKHVIETCSDLYYYFNKMKCEENLFYLKIFHNYLAMAKIIIDKKPERKNNLFTKNDFNTMRLCAISWDWYVYYFLFRYSSTVFKWYTSEKASPFLKMLVTKLFKLIYS
jgi:hypothetical protein